MTVANAALLVLPGWRNSGSNSTDDVWPHLVVNLVRRSALQGLTLNSDRAPTSLVVFQQRDEVPRNVWLQDPMPFAIISLGAAAGFWCQIAYQFGHELGHVIANAWSPQFVWMESPCYWIDELLAEAFALFALTRLSGAWSIEDPRGRGDYAKSIESYRLDFDKRHLPPSFDPSLHYQQHATELLSAKRVVASHHALAAWLAHEFVGTPTLVEDIAAMNRWPPNQVASLGELFSLWRESCRAIGSPGGLPDLLAATFD